MQNNQKPSKKTRLNLLIPVALVVIAVGLLIASRLFLPQSSNLTQNEIEEQIASLSTPAPSAEPTLIPEESEAIPAVTETPSNGDSTEALPAGYLFIILNDRIWGIEPLGEERDVTVDQGNGVVNVIHLLPDGFYMASSTCDNQLCVGEGTVTLNNWQQRILGPCVYCLPHQLTLELVVPNAQPDPNAPDA